MQERSHSFLTAYCNDQDAAIALNKSARPEMNIKFKANHYI
jgi:hypothetical protein